MSVCGVIISNEIIVYLLQFFKMSECLTTNKYDISIFQPISFLRSLNKEFNILSEKES